MKQQEHTNHLLIVFMATMATTISFYFFAPSLTSLLLANFVYIVQKQKINQRKKKGERE
jgi:hypothetical protein